MSTPSRRAFLASSAVLAAVPGLPAAGDDTLKVGLIGCGGRGTGAAINALAADKNVKLVALADAFEDRLTECLDSLLKKPDVAAKVDVKPDARFVGFDAYKSVIERCDVVLLCTPPHFRPLHLKAAVEAGKHVFAEKPCAVDAPGVRSVLATCEAAKKKNLSIVSGLCIRFDNGFRETVKRIHEGAIGDVVMVQANDYRGGRWSKPRLPEWSDMTYQMRNWYNFTWLSGDFNVEQHVHFLDVCAWIMKDQYPVRAMGMGGRTVLAGTEYGNIYDHFSVVYEYPDGQRFLSNTRQQPKTKGDMSAHALGTKGRAMLAERDGGLRIKGDKDWTFDGPKNQMYQTEHDDLFASIRKGMPINNGEYMAKSTLLAIMGRMAAYTGQQVTWEMALHSKEDLTPPKYDWAVKLPDPPIAIPGVTKFV
ncbi:MAG TPA: Gfo/Idh/MocA family oxidoreductase [Gemmataceae bacterium]|nr:Gfo/Idh/MocA family oxidoreductase [Gemmataceae bacterium]